MIAHRIKENELSKLLELYEHLHDNEDPLPSEQIIFRKNGLGKMVLQAALDFAWENNCYKVMLMTGRLNKGTFRFYGSAGFDRNSKQAFIIKK